MIDANVEKAKINAAKRALAFLDKATIIGVGTGSTIKEFINVLGEERDGFKDRLFVASSYDTMLKLSKYGFRVLHPTTINRIDVYIDGADEVDGDLNMIKGGGAALTLEKILTYYSTERIFLVDYTKLVSRLGEKHPIPLDVLPYAVSFVHDLLMRKGYNPRIRRLTKGKYGPVVSDIGGIIIDIKPVSFDPVALEKELKNMPGVIETGLFIGLADKVILGYPDKTLILSRNRLDSTTKL